MKRMRQAASALLLAAACCAAPLMADSLETGPEIPLSPNPGRGGAPAVARGADGAFLVLWKKQDGSLANRRLGADGSPEPGETTLFRPSQDGQGGSELEAWDLVALPEGGYVAALGVRLSVPLGFDHRIRLRRLDAFGRPLGAAKEGPQGGLSSAALDRSGEIVVLASQGSTMTALRFSADGTLLGAPVVVMQDSVPFSVAILPDGGFAVARADRSGAVWQVTVRLLDRQGEPRGSAVPVGTTASDPGTAASDPAGRLRVAAGPAGHVAVAWVDGSVKVRLYGPDGEPAGGAIVAGMPEPGPAEAQPSIVSLDVRSTGALLLHWARGADLLARAFDPQGRPLGPNVPNGRSSETGGFAVDTAATPAGWIAAGAAEQQGFQGSGPWLRLLTLPCAGLGGPGLCLQDDRFHATVTWRVPATGAEGVGTPIPKNGDTGAFWFFDPANHELNLKVLDGRGTNGHFWVFYGSLTDVEFDLTVTDTYTGEVRTYHNPAGTMASRGDTTAF